MKVELTEHPEGNQRFEITLGEMLYIISLEEGKKLADLIYELHPTCKAERDCLLLAIKHYDLADMLDEKRAEILDMCAKGIVPPYARDTLKDEGFFCQKCGTVYETEIMACRICNPKAYASLT